MSEEALDREIEVLMAREIVEDACGSVKDARERAKCRAVLHRILVRGEGIEALLELSEETRRAIAKRLKEMGVG